MIEDGIAYFGAGIIDHDGTYIYAVDAKSGQIKWQNNSSGHLAPILRKGVSIQGNLAVLGDQLLLAGGNQVSPAPFNIKTGELNAKPFAQGQPKANNGSFVGVFNGKSAIVGGRILYSAVDNVATKGSYVTFTDKGRFSMNYGGVPPAWNSKTMVLVNFKHGSIQCYDAQRVLDKMDEGLNTKITDAPQRRRFMNLAQALHDEGGRWESNFGESNKFEAVSLVVCPNAVVTVVRNQQKARSQPQWYVAALNIKNGNPIFRHELRGDPLPGGLLIGRDGQIIVTMIDGSLLSFAPKQ
jgi:outer membrane protein assembly factor BamB